MNWNIRYKKAVCDACREISEMVAPEMAWEHGCRLIVTKHLTPLFRELRDEAKNNKTSNSIMKTKSIIAGLIVLVLIGATSVWPRKATAQPDQRVAKHQVVILHAQEWSNNTRESQTTYLYRYSGLRVYNSDSSSGAPVFTNLAIEYCNCPYTNEYGEVLYGYNKEVTTPASLADSMAKLMDDGFRVASVIDTGNPNDYSSGGIVSRIIMVK